MYTSCFHADTSNKGFTAQPIPNPQLLAILISNHSTRTARSSSLKLNPEHGKRKLDKDNAEEGEYGGSDVDLKDGQQVYSVTHQAPRSPNSTSSSSGDGYLIVEATDMFSPVASLESLLKTRELGERMLTPPVWWKIQMSHGVCGRRAEAIDLSHLKTVYSVQKAALSFDKANVNGVRSRSNTHSDAVLFCICYVLMYLRHSGSTSNCYWLPEYCKQRNVQVFVASMCIGPGMGMAAVFVSEH
ncbi:uncharacterized protein EDB91DRAFT_1079503 [Suillus paluster]|uniref:uncharacterized protein n=1 Tax=Suillus paluster TaxID=48578 RepID=UPI001B872BF3|nr:uncharacterized protein EDB91DRAFT_1079503 [Suillus paluster]KAG1747783.1 hypothetical protein EDB91DRAFT_1079503 [Suillus paluster]